MYNRRHLGGLNLKAKALKVGQRVKFNVIKCQCSIPQTKLYKWFKFESLSLTSIHNNCLRFDLVSLLFMTHIRTWPRRCQKNSDQVLSEELSLSGPG